MANPCEQDQVVAPWERDAVLTPVKAEAFDANPELESLSRSMEANRAPSVMDSLTNGVSMPSPSVQAQNQRIIESVLRNPDKPPADIYTLSNLAGNFAENVQDLGVGAVKAGGVAVKGVGDIAQLLTGGAVGSGLSGEMERWDKLVTGNFNTQRTREQKADFNKVMQDKNQTIGDMFGAMGG